MLASLYSRCLAQTRSPKMHLSGTLELTTVLHVLLKAPRAAETSSSGTLLRQSLRSQLVKSSNLVIMVTTVSLLYHQDVCHQECCH